MTQDNVCPRCGRPIPPDAPAGICPYCLIADVVAPAPAPMWTAASRDKNLIFALFAYQFGLIKIDQFADAVAEWVENPSVLLADRLVEQGILSAASRKYLDGFIAYAIEFHGGNVSNALETLGGHERIANLLKGSARAVARDLIQTKLALRVSEDMLESEPSPETAVDEKPGRYTGSSEYSRGGMGRILLVHDELLGRTVALKELLPPSDSYTGPSGEEVSPMRASAALLARFLREARITGRLEHPSIVPVYELGRRPNGSLYYTMRLVRGRTLRTVLEESKSLEDRLKLLPNFVDLCMGLAYAHSKGVVHRDIKPSNVMIGEFGETVIIDWGLAKIVDSDETFDDTLHRMHGSGAITPDQSAAGEILGSPHYMSPEQASGKVNQIDARTDVFSLGVLLYEILTNHAAFDKSSLEELVDVICNEEPVPVSTHEPHVPRELISICQRAMQKNKGDRYPSAMALGNDVSRFLAGSIVSAYNYGPIERLQLFYKRRKAVTNMAIATLIIVITTVAIAFVRIDTARIAAIEAKDLETAALRRAEQSRDAEIAARRDAEAAGYHNAILLASEFLKDRSPEAARSTLWSTPPDLRRWEASYLLHLAYDRRYSIEAYNGIAVQTGGTLAAFFYRDNPISIRDVDTGEQRALLTVPPRVTITHVAVSPTGRYVAAVATDGVVHVWDLPANRELYATSGSPRVRSVAFSENGESLLVGTDDGTAEIWTAGTGTPSTTFVAAGQSVRRAAFSPDESFIYGLVDDAQWEVWNVETRGSVLNVPGSSVAMTESNRLAVVNDGELAIWDALDATPARRPIVYASPFRDVRYRTATDQFAALTTDGEVGLWDVESGLLVRRFWDRKMISEFALSPDGGIMATWDLENRLTMWDVATGARLRTSPGLHSYIFRQYAQFSGDGRYFLASMNPSGATISSVWEAGSDVQRLLRHERGDGIGPGIAVSRDRSRAAFLTAERVLLTHPLTGPALGTGVFLPAEVDRFRAAFGATADELVFAGDEFTPLAINVSTGVIQAAFYGHTDRLTAIDCDPTRDEVATGCGDARVRIWNRATGDLLRELEGHAGAVTVVRYREDGGALFSADDHGELRIWDPSTGALVAQASVTPGVISGEWSPAMDLVAIGTKSGDVTLLDGPALTNPRLIPGSPRPIQSLAFLNEDRLVSADFAGLRILNTLRGDEALSIADTISASTDVHALDGGRRLLTRCMDGTLRVWDPHPWDSGADRAQFELRRAAVPAAATPDFTSFAPSRIIAVTTPEILRDSLANLRDALAADSPQVNDEGVIISTPATQRAVARLGLMAGDTLAALRRTEIRSVEAARDAVNVLIGELDANPAGVPVQMRVIRAGTVTFFEFAYVPIEQVSTAAQLDAAEATELFSTSLTALAAARDSLTEFSRRTAPGGSPGTGAEIPGLLLTAAGDADLERFRRLGMSSADRILSVNGAPVTSVEVYETAIRETLQRIESGPPAQLVMEIERGIFQRVEHTIDVR